MTKISAFFLVLMLAGVAACEKTKSPSKGHEHNEGDAHAHTEGDGHDHDKKK